MASLINGEPGDSYYIYVIVDDQKVFYVGFSHTSDKRTFETRWIEHRSRARLGNKGHLYCKLRRLWQAGRNPQLQVLMTGLTETQAIEIEKTLIQRYGKDNLCNCSDGGETHPKDGSNWYMGNSKPVKCIEYGVTYPSIKATAKATGYSYEYIQRLVGGLYFRKSNRRRGRDQLHFVFVEPNEEE